MKYILLAVLLICSTVTSAQDFPSTLKGLYGVFPSGNVIAFERSYKPSRYVYLNNQKTEPNRVFNTRLFHRKHDIFTVSLAVQISGEIAKEQYQVLYKKRHGYRDCGRIFEYPEMYHYQETRTDYWVFTHEKKLCHMGTIQLDQDRGTCRIKRCDEWTYPDWVKPDNPQSKLYIFQSRDKAIAFAKEL